MNKKYDLIKALYDIFHSKDNIPVLIQLHKELLEKTGLTEDEFRQLASQNQTVGQLKYRILGLMDKKKLDSSHIV